MVMAGRVYGAGPDLRHPRLAEVTLKTPMAGTSPAMKRKKHAQPRL
jgi:hypothetical protein